MGTAPNNTMITTPGVTNAHRGRARTTASGAADRGVLAAGALGRGARAGRRGRLTPTRQPARSALTCAAAAVRAACGWLLPSSTETIMLPRTVEIFGYVVICGRACLTSARFETKAESPGSEASIALATLGWSATDSRVGRSPVFIEKYLTWAGAVSQSRNCSAAVTRAEPLLNITQLSGPEMV